MAHVPKYILAKAKRLNKTAEGSELNEKLAKEITHWLSLSGVSYADIRLVESLKKGVFESDEAIKKGFDELMD